MTTNPSDAAPGKLYQVYAEELRIHAVMLIWLGYRRMNAPEFSDSEEDDITGELVREMKLAAQDPSSPEWVDRYEIHEQIRQNVPGKRGKNRPIMDIEIERHQRGPRPSLSFEAKRLWRGKRISGYLGHEGLAAFLSGHYPTTHGEAGMLAYSQEQNQDEWSAKLFKELSRNSRKHRVSQGGDFQDFKVDASIPAYTSGHIRENGTKLLIIHVLLSFSS